LSVYAKLGSPGINFSSFWDVYNQLRDAIDSDFLERTTTGTFVRHEESASESEDDGVVEQLLDDQLPLSGLRPCVFGENGVPAGGIHEGEVNTLFPIWSS